jgi:hypothetical protein
MRFARHLYQRPANSLDELLPVLLTGRNGRRASISSLTSLLNRVCSLILSPLLPMPPFSIGCGLTTSRPTLPKHKANGVCDHSVRGGHVRTLDRTYVSSAEQTSLRLFFALGVLENKPIYGADVSNAFAQAPPPVQTFYMRVDRVFQHWWTTHLKRPTIPYGHVLPVRRALKDHPESPRF